MFNIQLVNSSTYPINYQLSPDQKQVFLNPAPDSRAPAGFLLSNLPNFLQQVGGLYLGQPYYPQLNINGQMYYLQATSRQNVYDLVRIEQDTSRLFGFVLIRPEMNWQTPYDLSNITFYNFSTGSSTKFSFVGTPPRSGPLVYSPLLCSGDCQMCGDICPDLFNCVAGQCVNNLTQGPSFGLRGRGSNGQDYIYTYKIISMGGGQALLMTATYPKFISAQVETNDIVRERYFYTDYDNGDTQFVVGKSYPIYTIVNGQKRYLSTPVRPPNGGQPAVPNPTSGPTLYSLTPNPVGDTARFTPKVATSWGQYTLTPDQFPNLAYTEPQNLALWQTSALMGTTAVAGPVPALLGVFPETVAPVLATVGSPELPPTFPLRAFPEGSPCSADTDCDGWGPGVGQTSCCGSICQKRLRDWSGSGVCPDLCRGCPACNPGTCGSTAPLLGGALFAGATGATGTTGPTPLWKQWWFWIVITVIIVLIIIVIAAAIWPRPKLAPTTTPLVPPVRAPVVPPVRAPPPALPTLIPPPRA